MARRFGGDAPGGAESAGDEVGVDLPGVSPDLFGLYAWQASQYLAIAHNLYVCVV